jgi:uncharacterized protein YgiM (DUF1202 family)
VEHNPQQSPEGFTSEDEEATYCLSLLRDGDRHQKIVARERLSQIFERRGMLDEAAQCLESNIREGVRDPRVYQRLAGVYRRQGRHELADEVLLEARRLAERVARSQSPGARRSGRPSRPVPGSSAGASGPAGAVGPAVVPPGVLDAPTVTMPATSAAPPPRQPEPAMPTGSGPAPADDFGSEAATIGMGSGPAVAPGDATGRVNRPWYVSPAMVVLLLLLCGPYGLALMWVQGGYAHATKVRVASIWAALMVLVLGGAAVTLQSQLMPLLTAGTTGVRGLPGINPQATPIVFGTPPAAGVGAKPTMLPGLAPSPPAIVVSPGALPPRTDGTIVAPGPGAGPTGEPSAGQLSPAPEATPPAPAEKPTGEQVRVTDGANLRERPGQSAPVVKTVPEGTILQVVGADQPMDGKGWKNVRDDTGTQGWIAAELLEPAP